MWVSFTTINAAVPYHGVISATKLKDQVMSFADGAWAINGSTIPVEDGFQIFKNS